MSLNLKAKTILPVTVILLVIMAGLAVYNYTSEVSILTEESESILRDALISAHTKLESRLNSYQEMAALVAGMPRVAETFAKGEREKLATEFSQGFGTLKKEFKVAQFQFHRPPAISFLRLHLLDKYGDDLSAFRNTVLYVNSRKAPAGGVEVGRGGIGLRGVEPVFSKGAHVGSVEFGGDLVSPIEEIRKTYDLEVGLLLTKEATALVWEGLPKNIKMIGDFASFYASNPELAQGVLKPEFLADKPRAGEKTVTTQASFGGRSYDVAVSPLKDYNAKAVGYIYALKDRTPLLSRIRTALIVNLAVSILILSITVFVIVFVMRKVVLDPLLALTNAADDVSLGKLGQKVEAVGATGEITLLAKSIDRMRISMKKLLE